jgi:hypothetical protein
VSKRAPSRYNPWINTLVDGTTSGTAYASSSPSGIWVNLECICSTPVRNPCGKKNPGNKKDAGWPLVVQERKKMQSTDILSNHINV